MNLLLWHPVALWFPNFLPLFLPNFSLPISPTLESVEQLSSTHRIGFPADLCKCRLRNSATFDPCRYNYRELKSSGWPCPLLSNPDGLSVQGIGIVREQKNLKTSKDTFNTAVQQACRYSGYESCSHRWVLINKIICAVFVVNILSYISIMFFPANHQKRTGIQP